MEYDAIVQMISSVGFPIGACIFMFWYLHKEKDNHKEEVMQLTNVINQNTQILMSLKQLLEDKLNEH